MTEKPEIIRKTENGWTLDGKPLDADQLARMLHEEIYRQFGWMLDDIIAEWNARSPEDPW